jgi:tetratricopeptide (TPR) repeat protein
VNISSALIESLAKSCGLPAVIVVEAPEGGGRTQWMDICLQDVAQRDARTWLLNCDFGIGGPWAGISNLFSTLLVEIESRRPDLLESHALELVQALPNLHRKLMVRNPTLTDTSSPEEKVRNYPVDRAFRLVHGLIDLLSEWKEFSRDQRPWVIACDSLDRAGSLSSRFFRELIRRRAEKLKITLIAVVEPTKGQDMCRQFCVSEDHLFSADILPVPSNAEDNHQAAVKAQELERLVEDDEVEKISRLPELISLWARARDSEKTFKWKCYALDVYNTRGLYEDALRYGEDALAMYKELGKEDARLHWGIFLKMFMNYIGVRNARAAYRLAEQEALARPLSNAWRGQLYYLVAMLHARYLPERDLKKAEEYLEAGLELLEQSDLSDGERHFQSVFNRNGLAMVRNLQRRYDEAIELCRTGYERLNQHLGESQHRLHRSVLLYNIAQVKMAVGAYEEAIEHYTAAMLMDPNYSEYYNDRGSAFLRLGLLEESLADYQKAIDLSPPYHEIYTNLGQCYRKRGDLVLAIDAYSRALDLDPGQVLPWIGRAKAREELGLTEDAIADYDVALALDPNQWDILASRAVLYYESGLFLASLKDLGEAIKLSPEVANLYSNRSAVLAALGKHREAIDDLDKYMNLSPEAEDRKEIEGRRRKLEELARSAITV